MKRKEPNLVAVHNRDGANYTLDKYLNCQASVIRLLGMLARLGLESAQLDCKEADNGFMKFGNVYIDDYVERVNWINGFKR